MEIIPEQRVPVANTLTLSDIPMLERARLACNTVKTLFGDAPAPTDEEKEIARQAFTAFTDDKGVKAPSMSVVATYPNASLVHLDRMLSEYDHELINSAVRIREYTKNKLLVDSENPDGRIRIRALELLGKMKDVGLFTDRIEVTHRTKTDAELEEELHKKLERYMGDVLVVGGAENEEQTASEDEEEETQKSFRPNLDEVDAFIDKLA